ncbi:MAG: hypothetical protein MUC88_02645 [Planctomycetes bacterium]|jgi:hypothetical protein|nr:hypothetical protein [Planctomycetota bacterium]
MSERKDERWLDEQLRRAVAGTTPVFDARVWKEKHSREFQTLLRRSAQPDRSGMSRTVRLILSSSIAKLAIAAAVVAAMGVILAGRFGPGPDLPVTRAPVPGFVSPARMVSMIELSAAFRRGGIDELDRQCERAMERLGPRPGSVSIQEVLKDIMTTNGKG